MQSVTNVVAAILFIAKLLHDFGINGNFLSLFYIINTIITILRMKEQKPRSYSANIDLDWWSLFIHYNTTSYLFLTFRLVYVICKAFMWSIIQFQGCVERYYFPICILKYSHLNDGFIALLPPEAYFCTFSVLLKSPTCKTFYAFINFEGKLMF